MRKGNLYNTLECQFSANRDEFGVKIITPQQLRCFGRFLDVEKPVDSSSSSDDQGPSRDGELSPDEDDREDVGENS